MLQPFVPWELDQLALLTINQLIFLWYSLVHQIGVEWNQKSPSASYLGWIPRIFRSFFCAKIFYFGPFHMKTHIKKCKKMLKFFRLFLNIHDFFDFCEVFPIKLFCPVRCSHVLYIIRFSIKFCVGEILSSRCATLCKIVIYQKPSKNVILRGLKLRRFTRNQINLH